MATEKPYWMKLRNPLWQRLRLERMSKAGFKCEHCEEANDTLNVHHRIYRKGKEPWEYELSDLICLCEKCHEEEHRWRDQLKEIMAKLDVYDIERLCGYAKGLHAMHGWESEDATKLPDVVLSGAEECTGVTDALGLWPGDPEYVEVFDNYVPVVRLLRFQTDASERRRSIHKRLQELDKGS